MTNHSKHSWSASAGKLTVLALTCLSTLAAQPYLFNQAAYPLSPPAFETGRSILKGDFNGDGLTDVVVYFEGSPCTFTVFLGTTNGTFAEGTPVSCGSNTSGFERRLLAGDVNGDKKLDLVLASASEESRTVTVYFGNGDGTFQAPVGSTPASGIIAVGDFNGDGRADLVEGVSGNPAGIQLTVLLSNGDGTFTPGASPSAPVAQGSGVTGDFNHDGKSDLAMFGSNSSGDLFLTTLMGNGDGTFQAPVVYAAPTNTGFGTIVAADLNRDGNLDVIVDGPSVFLGRKDGTFETPLTSAVLGFSPFDVADFNGDGIPDLVTERAVALGDGHGHFYENPLYATLGEGLAGDFNGDGKMDLAVLSGDNPLIVSLGNGDGSTVVSEPGVLRYQESQNLSALATGDFNGDGKPDLVTLQLGSTSGDVDVILGNGDGLFQQANRLRASTNSSLTGLALGDFNHDGKLDIAVTELSDASVLLLLGHGDGTLTTGATLAVGNQPTCVAEADFNGDGYPDLIVGNNKDNTVSVLLGAANGTFQPQVVTSLQSIGGPRTVITGDFNRDGKPDAAVLTGIGLNSDGAQYVTVLLGKGDGTFVSQTVYPAACGDTTSGGLAAGDLRSVGTPDLLLLCESLYVLRGMGDGTFAAPAPVGSFGGGTGAAPIVVADLNGDGKPDVALGGGAGLIYVLTGNGDDTFGLPRVFDTTGPLQYLAVADFNGDGAPDVAASSAVILSDPAPSLSARKLSFPKTKVGNSSVPQTVTLSNLGSMKMNLISTRIEGPDGDFGLGPNDCASPMLPGASCTFTIDFEPLAKGARKATLVITDSAAGYSQTVALSGTGK